jgi:hypothetical protein
MHHFAIEIGRLKRFWCLPSHITDGGVTDTAPADVQITCRITLRKNKFGTKFHTLILKPVQRRLGLHLYS